jgi:hypothetical protein
MGDDGARTARRASAAGGWWAHLLLLAPRDVLRGLDGLLHAGRMSALARVMVGLLAGWWLYVPLHELLHAAGCVATGGSVSRLEVAPLYGGALLADLLPFVVAGGDYAGRLSGFDTGGSDLVYLATDLAPFLLTLFPGVWWMRRSARRQRPLGFGLSLPFALAPFLSLPGDAYEVGSILATRLPPWSGGLRVPLRGDDVALVAAQVVAGGGGRELAGLAVAALFGLGWALLTYALGGRLATAAGAPPLAPLAAAAPGPVAGAPPEGAPGAGARSAAGATDAGSAGDAGTASGSSSRQRAVPSA